VRADGLGAAIVIAVVLSACSQAGPGVASPAALRSPVTASLDLPGLPGAAAADPDGLWIANYNLGTITRVSRQILHPTSIPIGDPASLQPSCEPGSVHDAPTGSFIIRRCDLPAGLAVGAGSVWTARNDLQAVVRIDPPSGRMVATIPVGMHVFNIAASDSEVWVTAYEDNLIARIDPLTNAVTFKRHLDHAPSGITLAYGSVWIALSGGAAVARLDPQTGAVRATIPVGRGPFPIIASAGVVWVRCEQDSTLAKIDPATNRVAATISVDPFYGTDGLDSMVGRPDGVWISGLNLQWIDASTNRMGRILPLGGRPYDAGHDALWIVDPTGRVSRLLPGGAP
jgi:hypothetical protein